MRRDARIEARRQPVDEHLLDEFRQLLGVFVARGQRVPVGDEEIALVLVLQLDPVLERAVIVAEMQLAGRPHSGKNSFGLRMTAHVKRAKYTGVGDVGLHANGVAVTPSENRSTAQFFQ